jgi:type IV secretory pathway VirB10-like protein
VHSQKQRLPPLLLLPLRCISQKQRLSWATFAFASFASLALCVGRLLPLQRKEKVRPFCLCVATVKSKGRHKLRCLLPSAAGHIAAGSREHGAGSREHGAGSREQGAGWAIYSQPRTQQSAASSQQPAASSQQPAAAAAEGKRQRKGKRGALFLCNLCFGLCYLCFWLPLLLATASSKQQLGLRPAAAAAAEGKSSKQQAASSRQLGSQAGLYIAHPAASTQQQQQQQQQQKAKGKGNSGPTQKQGRQPLLLAMHLCF